MQHVSIVKHADRLCAVKIVATLACQCHTLMTRHAGGAIPGEVNREVGRAATSKQPCTGTYLRPCKLFAHSGMCLARAYAAQYSHIRKYYLLGSINSAFVCACQGTSTSHSCPSTWTAAVPRGVQAITISDSDSDGDAPRNCMVWSTVKKPPRRCSWAVPNSEVQQRLSHSMRSTPLLLSGHLWQDEPSPLLLLLPLLPLVLLLLLLLSIVQVTGVAGPLSAAARTALRVTRRMHRLRRCPCSTWMRRPTKQTPAARRGDRCSPRR